MHPDGSQLLRQLEPAVRPGSLGPKNRAGAVAQGGENRGSFDALLAQMMHSTGGRTTGRPVTVDSILAADIQVPQAVEAPLAEAVDAAESAGARRALVLTPGAAYMVDVAARRIIGHLPAEPGRFDLERVDVAVSARDPESPPALTPPPASLHHVRHLGIEQPEPTGARA